MCGRFIQTREALKAAKALGLVMTDLGNVPDRYNAAPSQELWIVRRNHKDAETSLDPLRWGLIPSFVDDPKGDRRPINAKAETVASSGFFRGAFKNRRCLIPADGFYEWKTSIDGRKQPMLIAGVHGPLFLGGLWENWKNPTTGDWQRTFAIITTSANDNIAAIHDRMPLVIGPADHQRWLSDEPAPLDLLKPAPSEGFVIRPVSTRVNSPRNDDRSLLDPIEADKDVADLE